MTTVRELAQWMEIIAPRRLSEDWDNTGLLLGDFQRDVRRLMTCLTLTPESVDEAVSERAEMVISHHPLPFRPMKSLTTADTGGRLLWELASRGISVYSPHTSWDSASSGINAQLAELVGLHNPMPLLPEKAPHHSSEDETPVIGGGRFGDLASPLELESFAKLVASQVPNCRLRGVDCRRVLRRVGIACGSGGSLLSLAVMQGCDVFLTGEATFHQCLEAKAAGVSMLLIGHFASEKFAMNRLAELCKQQFPALEVWGSRAEQDPVRQLM